MIQDMRNFGVLHPLKIAIAIAIQMVEKAMNKMVRRKATEEQPSIPTTSFTRAL